MCEACTKTAEEALASQGFKIDLVPANFPAINGERIQAAVEKFEQALADSARLARLKAKVLLTEEEAAELGYFVSAAAAATLRSKKLGPFYCRVANRAIRYRVSDLEAWLEHNRVVTMQTTPEDCPARKAAS